MQNRKPQIPIFPPIVPNAIPAFDGKSPHFKIFFKKSPANFAGGLNENIGGETFEHVQVSINRLDNNRNAINLRQDYNRSGYIIAIVSKDETGKIEALDDYNTKIVPNRIYKVYGKDVHSPYCLVLPTIDHSFFDLDILYKIQIRLGSQSLTEQQAKNLNRNDLSNLTASEWSSVVTMKPITKPDFGVTGFTEVENNDTLEGFENTIATSNFNYVGYYQNNYIVETRTGAYIASRAIEQKYKLDSGREVLSEYRFVLKTGNGSAILDDSGYQKITEHERKNITHTFSYTTKDREKYVVEFHIKTANGYSDKKVYLLTPKYKRLNASNSLIRLTSEEYRARMRLDIQAKQVVFEPSIDEDGIEGKFEFVKDNFRIENGEKKGDPMMDMAKEEVDKIKSTHVLFDGSATTNKSFFLTNEYNKDRWICEIKASGWIPYDNREVALVNPYVQIRNDVGGKERVSYFTDLKVIYYKKNVEKFGLTTEIIEENGIKKFKPMSKSDIDNEVNYVFEVVKTSYKKNRDQSLEDALANPIGEQTVRRAMFEKDSTKPNPYFRWFEGMERHKGGLAEDLISFVTQGNWDDNKNERPNPVDDIYIKKDYLIPNEAKKFKKQSEQKTQNDLQAGTEYYIYLANYDGSISFYITETQYNYELEKRNYYITDNNQMINFFTRKEKYVEEKKGGQ